MADIFDPSYQPNNDAAFSAAQATSSLYQTNALMQQQQTMFNATSASMTPGYFNPGAGYVQPTMTIASNQLMQGMSNVARGTMAASSDLMQAFSGMGASANRFMVGQKYNDVYAGPNSYALETSIRREAGSALGFDHTTVLGRMLLGGYRPDFMSEKAFQNQMQASLASRFSTSNLITGGAGITGAIVGGLSGGIVGSLVAQPIFAGAARLINAEEGLYNDKTGKEAVAKYINMRIGFGAEGYMDTKTIMGLEKSINEYDTPTWASRVLGRTISRKLGLGPEIGRGEVRDQMFELGMFANRSGAYDTNKMEASIKSFTDTIKELAGVAGVLKDEIIKTAAELQRAGGFTSGQQGIMNLTKQAVLVSGSTGIGLDIIRGTQSKMMQAATQFGFDRESTGRSTADVIAETMALKNAGLIPQTIDPVSFAEKMQMGMMTNQRTNIFAMQKPGETINETVDNYRKNPKDYLTDKYQGHNIKENAFEKQVRTIGNRWRAKLGTPANAQYLNDNFGRTNILRMTIDEDPGSQNLSDDEKQALVFGILGNATERKRVQDADSVLDLDRKGKLVGMVGEEKAKKLVAAARSIPRLSTFLEKDSNHAYSGTDEAPGKRMLSLIEMIGGKTEFDSLKNRQFPQSSVSPRYTKEIGSLKTDEEKIKYIQKLKISDNEKRDLYQQFGIVARLEALGKDEEARFPQGDEQSQKTYRILTQGYKLTNADIQKSEASLEKSGMKGYLADSGKQFAPGDQAKFLKYLRGDTVYKAIIANSETLDSTLKADFAKGGKMGPDEMTSLRSTLEGVGKLGGVDAEGADLSSKNVSFEALEKMNTLLDKIVVALGGGPNTANEPKARFLDPETAFKLQSMHGAAPVPGHKEQSAPLTTYG